MSTAEIKWTDRRGENSPDADDDRLRRRQAIREEMARAIVATRRRDELLAAEQEVNARLDRLAAEHSEEMAPIQQELEDTQNKIVQCIARRESVPETIEARRRELLAEIDSANRKLERDIADERSALPHIAAEIQKVVREASEVQPLENQLCGERYGNPQWLDEYSVSKSVVDALANAASHFRKMAEDAGDHLRSFRTKHEQGRGNYARDISELETRQRRWQGCVARVRQLQQQVSSEATALRQRLLDE